MANHNVTVSLQLLYDPRSARAFQQMATEAQRAQKAASESFAGKQFGTRQAAIDSVAGTAANLGAYGAANTMGRIGSMAQGLQSLGMGNLAGLAQSAAVPVAIAKMVIEKGMEIAEKSAAIYYDKYSSPAQQARAVFRDFMPGGERMLKFADAITGRAAGYEQAGINAQFLGAHLGAQGEALGFQMTQNPQVAALRGAQAFYGQTSPVMPSLFNRSTAAGELAYREEQRVLPLMQAQARAQKDMMVSTAARVQSERELTKLTAYGNDLVQRRAHLQSKLESADPIDQFIYGSGPEREGILRQVEELNKYIGQNLAQRREGSQRVLESRRREFETRGEFGKARARSELIGEAENLEARAESASGAARRLGSMNAFDRAIALNAARMIQERGSVEGFPPELVQAARTFAPETIDKIIENTGKGTAEFQAGVAEFPGESGFAGGDPEAQRARATQLRREAAEIEFKIDATTNAQITQAFETFGRDVGKLIQEGLDRALNEARNTLLLGRNEPTR